jgi:phage terminase small subunit
MTNLPVNSPAQALVISPEALEVANQYLVSQNVQGTALELGYAPDQVSEILDRKEVRAYINSIFLDVGFNNRFRIRGVMDALIQKKLQEMDEAEIGSSKDIADLLALSHKMTMEHLDREIKLEQARNANKVQTQVNMQVNEFGGADTKYGSLISKLLGATT